jgi:OmpA-OmpF porin, OOP family
MKLSKLILIAISAALLSTPVLQVSAADSAKKAYFKIDAGVSLMSDVEVEGSYDKVKMDPGFRIGLIGGYDLCKWAALELETGFLYNSVKDESSVWFGTIPVLANAVFRYENTSKFVPYVGAGAGGAYTLIEGDEFSESDFVFAWQVKAGCAYNISDTMAIDVGYKFFMTGDLDVGGDKVKEPMSHFIGLGFTWKF